MKLSREQLCELIDRLEALHAARSLGQLIVSTVDLIQPFFDTDTYSAGFTDPRRRRHISVMCPANPRFLEAADRYRELAKQSPLLQYWLRTGDHDRVLRRSDCCDSNQYRHCALYCEIDRLNNGEQLIGTWLRAGGGRHFEVAMGRGGRTDFSLRDVARLAVLRRHIYRAYLNVCDLQRPSAPMFPGNDDLPPDAVELQDTSLAAGIDASPARAGDDPALTPRERDVLRWIVEGKTNQEIGIILGISWRTVRLHCERIFQKLGVETRTAAAVRAMEMGLYVPASPC